MKRLLPVLACLLALINLRGETEPLRDDLGSYTRKITTKNAKAHYGVALAAGPHINYPLVPPPMAELAWKELTLAQQHADKCTPIEKALIEALSKRYAN